jgi:CheY-like chemotaxis protein
MSKPLHLFLVDDDADDREIFSEIIKESFPQAKFSYAYDGMHAIEKLKGDSFFIPDFIFIDINMPRMNGIKCLTQIKKIDRVKNVPAYMYSTARHRDIVLQCVELGALGFLAKESDLTEMKKQFEKIILGNYSNE